MALTERFKVGHEERFRVEDSEVRFSTDEKTGKRRFKAVAYSGVDVGRFWGRMVVNSSGLKRDEKMGMLLEHNDNAPVGVCEKHEVSKDGRVSLEGYFLSEKASDQASKLIAAADEGFPFKMSIGIRFLKHHDVEEGSEEEVNGRKFSGPITVVDQAHLFETSFIHVSPADLNTEATVMRAKAQERLMADKVDEKQGTPAASSTPPTVTASESRDAILAEGRRLEREERAKLRAAAKELLSGKAHKDLRLKVLAGEVTLDVAKVEYESRLKKRVAELEAEKAAREEALTSIGEQFANTGEGFNQEAAKTVSYDVTSAKLEDRVRVEFMKSPALAELWEDESSKALMGALRLDPGQRFKIPENLRRRLNHVGLIEAMSRAIRERAVELGDARFGVGKSGPDLSRVVVKGFIGSFYQNYEDAYVEAWSNKLAYQIPSDQEAELVRWLAAPPQLEPWTGPRIAKDLPIYSQILKNVLYESTLDVDKFDFNNQKFGLISKSMGEMGEVASQHWDIIFSALMEANPTAYDAVAFFAKTHTLGGDSGTMVNDLVSSGGFPSLAVADPNNVSQMEAARILLQCVPQCRTFKWANGIAINGKARKFAIMVPSVNPALEGAFLGATRSERLDLGQTNPLFATSHNFEVIPNPYLTKSQYVYVYRLDTPRTPFLKAEPSPIEMQFMGPGTSYAFDKHKYAMGLESTRGIAPGAWESAMRLTIGAA